MSTTDAALIDQRSIASFEKLYTSKGSPSELDEAFVAAYFRAVNNEAAPVLHKATAELGSSGNLKQVILPGLGKKFVVLDHIQSVAVEEISGYSYWPTSEEVASESQGAGEYNYVMENFKGNYVTVSVTKGLKPVKFTFISKVPKKVQKEFGTGKSVPVSA